MDLGMLEMQTNRNLVNSARTSIKFFTEGMTPATNKGSDWLTGGISSEKDLLSVDK